MCLLTIILLSAPGTPLDSFWQLNPDALSGFQWIGTGNAIALMLLVGVGCASAAVGLWRRTVWGARLAVAILSLNLVGDLTNALVRHDYRALLGLPIGGAMIVYLLRAGTKRSQRT